MWGITFDGFTIWRVFGVILFAALIALAILLTLPRSRNRRGNLVLGITIIWLLMLVFTGDVLYRWQLIVGLLPMLMVGYQLFFLWLYHPKEIAKQGPEKERPPTGLDNPKAATGTGQTEAPQDAEPEPVTVFDKADRLSMQSFKRAQDAINSHFSVRTLLIRYGLPAVLLGATGTVIIDLLIEPGTYFSFVHFVSEETAKQVLLGVKLGAVGAYVLRPARTRAPHLPPRHYSRISNVVLGDPRSWTLTSGYGRLLVANKDRAGGLRLVGRGRCPFLCGIRSAAGDCRDRTSRRPTS